MALPRWITAPVGQAARTAGRAYDYATPGAGTSTLTNAGRAIVDPNRVYTGGLNPLNLLPGHGGDDFARVGGGAAPQGGGGGGGQVQGASTVVPGGAGGAGGGGGGGPEDAAYWQDIISQLGGQLNNAKTAAEQGGKSLLDTFNLAGSRLNEDRSKTLRNFDLSQGTLDTNKRGTLNEINRGAASSARSLLGLLASKGAGVSSAAKFAVPTAISSFFGGQRGKALNNYGEQQQGLDVGRQDATTQYDRATTDLDTQRKEKEKSLREGSIGTENDILGRLADATTKLKLAQGGTYTGGADARKPFMERIAANNAAIGQLFDQFRSPSYNVAPVDVKAPAPVTNYAVDPLAVDLAGAGTPVETPSTYLPFFQRDKKNPYALAA